MSWGKANRFPESDKYKGHTARITFWVKSENISDGISPAFHPRNASGKVLAREQGNQHIHGTTDWTRHVITCRIPDDADSINVGFNFHGSGKFWIDPASIKYETVK